MFVREFYRNWTKYEVIWLLVASLTILSLSIYWGDSLLGIISALTGVICVVLTAKGKKSCYYFGIINTITYVIIAYINSYYGEVMLNALYYLPMQFVGIKIWQDNLNENQELKARNLEKNNKIKLIVISIISIIVYAFFLDFLNGELPLVDSASTVLSIMAMYLSVNRYVEQWLLWIIINILSIGMWLVAIKSGSDNISTLIMWSAYLINSFYGYISWKKSAIMEALK